MAAGVSLQRAVNAVGHARDKGTFTVEIVQGLRALGVKCADRSKRVSRVKPVLPRRAMVSIHGPGQRRWHWLLTWDGKIYDPGSRWPEGYTGWKMTSYLEIYS